MRNLFQFFARKSFVGLIVLANLFFLNGAGAQNASDDLAQLLSPIETLQASFSQKMLDKSNKPVSKATGKMALQRPGKFRWEVINPNRQLLIANGKKIWIYDPDLQQVTIRNLTSTAGESPALLLSNSATTLRRDFTVEMLKNEKGTQWYLLKPHDKSSLFESIKIGFANQVIQQMQLEDHIGNITLIQFSNLKTNAVLGKNLFTFTPPRGVDVINETQQ